MLKRRVSAAFMAVLFGAILYAAAAECGICRSFSFASNDIPGAVGGARGQEGGFPYGGSGWGEYGQKRAVPTAADARRMLKDYFSGRDVTVGAIRDRDFFFEADIMDRRGRVVDRVIVNKRTGRIRSIY